NVQIYKYVVKMVAHLNGKTATFMPKPLYGDNGSGMHVHMSLWKDGVNLFYDKKGYGKLSECAINYIGGILANARSVAINEKSARVEIRFPDSTSNPYLAFTSLLMAGLDGIKNKTIPVGPMDENLFALTLDEIREKGIEPLPHTLRGSLEALIRKNAFLKPVMSDVFIDEYQHMKFETQVWPVEARP
ncbi:type I glutamate--ammonia ligase, partial [Campylobacter fetus]|nr:type I glutamate--ammonia ligase [Campylobacter fetus]